MEEGERRDGYGVPARLRQRLRITTYVVSYTALGFLIWTLLSSEYAASLQRPEVFPAATAGILCIAGFAFQCWYWHAVVRATGVNAPFSAAVASVGLPILAKYIPGKIWAVLGRAMYMASITSGLISRMTVLSAFAQIGTVLFGVLIGGYALYASGDALGFGLNWWVVVVGIVVLATFAAGVWFKHYRTATDVIKELRRVSVAAALRAVTAVCLMWLAWGVGFAFLAAGFGIDVPWIAAVSVFAAACTVGIVALVFPGGIGIREGAMIGLLLPLGLPLEQAVLLSLASRAWFVVGEVVTFTVAVVLDRTVLNDWRVAAGHD